MAPWSAVRPVVSVPPLEAKVSCTCRSSLGERSPLRFVAIRSPKMRSGDTLGVSVAPSCIASRAAERLVAQEVRNCSRRNRSGAIFAASVRLWREVAAEHAADPASADNAVRDARASPTNSWNRLARYFLEMIVIDVGIRLLADACASASSMACTASRSIEY